MTETDQESGWEHLLRALREFWDMLVEKGYAGWLVWIAQKIAPDLDLTGLLKSA